MTVSWYSSNPLSLAVPPWVGVVSADDVVAGRKELFLRQSSASIPRDETRTTSAV